MRRRPHLIPALIVAGILLGALADLPYGYYQMLRWVTCGISAYITVKSYQWETAWATWLFAAIAILFNPLIPIELSKPIWRPIDIGCAVLFILATIVVKKPEESQSGENQNFTPSYCIKCGYKITRIARYCPKCGRPLESQEP